MTERKSLFKDETERWTPEASNLCNEAVAVLQPIFDKYYAMGYRAREISHVVQGAALEMELIKVI